MADRRKNTGEVIESALAGGIVGAALGALLTGKSKGTLASALLGAAIAASVKALGEAKENNLPVLFEENGVLYMLYPDGTKKLVKESGKKHRTIPLNFEIK